MISSLMVHLLLNFARTNSISAVVETQNDVIKMELLKVCRDIKKAA